MKKQNPIISFSDTEHASQDLPGPIIQSSSDSESLNLSGGQYDLVAVQPIKLKDAWLKDHAPNNLLLVNYARDYLKFQYINGEIPFDTEFPNKTKDFVQRAFEKAQRDNPLTPPEISKSSFPCSLYF